MFPLATYAIKRKMATMRVDRPVKRNRRAEAPHTAAQKGAMLWTQKKRHRKWVAVCPPFESGLSITRPRILPRQRNRTQPSSLFQAFYFLPP